MQDVQVSMEASQGLERRIRVNVPAQRIELEVETRLRSVGRTASIRGYRPGKVPEKVIRQRFGEQVRREVLQDMLQESYSEAVAREKLRPAGGPRIETESAELGRDLTYTAIFEVFPEIDLQGLDQLVIDRPEPALEDADIDFAIDNLRRQRAHWHGVERKSGDGDRVTIDFEGQIDGQPIEGGRGEQVAVVLGAGRMIPDFEQQLAGLGAGEEHKIVVNFPGDYPATELAGKKADFAIRVHEVAEEHLPEVDAEFIRAFGVQTGEIEGFRGEIRRNLEQEFLSRARADVKRQLLEQLLKTNPVVLPGVLVEQEATHLQSDSMRNLGITDPAQAPPLESFRDAAERRVRLGLLIGAAIRDNKLTPDGERVRRRVDEMARGYEKPDEVRKAYFQTPELLRQIENAVLEEQVIDWLTERASVTPKPTTFREIVRI